MTGPAGAPSDRGWSVPRLVAGMVVVAAAVVAVAPQHAVGVARVLVVSAALLALTTAIVDRLSAHDHEGVGAASSVSPFELAAPRSGPVRESPATLVRIRGELAGGQVLADVAPLSPLAARRLVAVVDTTLASEGLHRDDPAAEQALRARLSPQAWAALTAPRSGRTARLARDVGHRRSRRFARADEIAATVHAVLDELERPPRGAKR